MQYKKIFIWLGVIAVIVVLAFPFIMNSIICIIDTTNSVTYSDWVNFAGGYVGAIIGAAVSVAGVMITIRYTSKQNKIDRELQARPYCVVRYVKESKCTDNSKLLGEYTCCYEPRSNENIDYIGILYIQNVGLGTLKDFSFEAKEIGDERKKYTDVFWNNNKKYKTSTLQPGEEGVLTIGIRFNFDMLDKVFFPANYPKDKKIECQFPPEIANKYPSYTVRFQLSYKDMLENCFIQSIDIEVTISINDNTLRFIHSDGTKEVRPFYEAYLSIADSTPPKKIKR